MITLSFIIIIYNMQYLVSCIMNQDITSSPLKHLLRPQDDLKVCVWDVSLTPWGFALAHALAALLLVLAAPGPATALPNAAVKLLLFFTPRRSPVPQVVLKDSQKPHNKKYSNKMYIISHSGPRSQRGFESPPCLSEAQLKRPKPSTEVAPEMGTPCPSSSSRISAFLFQKAKKSSESSHSLVPSSHFSFSGSPLQSISGSGFVPCA